MVSNTSGSLGLAHVGMTSVKSLKMVKSYKAP